MDDESRERLADGLAGLAMDDPKATAILAEAGDIWTGWYPTAAWDAENRRWYYTGGLADAGSPEDGTLVLGDEAVVDLSDLRAALAAGDERAKLTERFASDEELGNVAE